MAGLFDDIGSAPSGGGMFDDIAAPVQPARTSAPHASSATEAALMPITNWPAVQREKAQESLDMISSGAGKVWNGDGIGKKALGAGQAALGALGYVTSPISATVKSFFGNPVEANTGINADLADLPVELALPGVGMTRMPTVVGRAVPAAFAGAPGRMAETAAAFERSNVNPSLPAVVDNRGVGTASKVVGDTVVGGPVTRATEEQFRQAGAQANRIADNVTDVGDKATAGERAMEGTERFANTTARDRQNELYQRARDLIQPQNSNRPPPASALNATLRAIQGVEARVTDPEIRAFVTDPNFVRLADSVRDAAQRGGLTFDDLRELRSQVRMLRPGEGSATGINRTAVDRVYDGLTNDMMDVARRAGGQEGAHALRRADQYTRALETVRLPAIQKIIDAKSGEDAFGTITRLAGSNASADWRRLAQIRRSMSPQEWNDIAGTAIRTMGEPKAANQGAAAVRGVAADTGFSPAEFMTNYAKLSERGRDQLFGTQAGLRGALDDLATVSSNLKRVERLGNPSGTARHGSVIASVMGVLNPSTTIPTLGAIGSGVAASRILSSPLTVRWLTAVERARQRGSAPMLAAAVRRIPTVAAGDTQVAEALKGLFQPRGGAVPAYAGDDASQQ